MEIILLDCGRGVLHHDIETFSTCSIPVTFTGDEPSIISISNGDKTVCKRVVNGTCNVDVTQFIGSNVKIIASTECKLWNCGSIRIEGNKGGIKVRSLTDFTPLIEECLSKIKKLEEKTKRLETLVDDLRHKGKSKSYKIV